MLADIEWPSLTSHIDKISESDQDYALELDRGINAHQPGDQAIVRDLEALSTQRVLAWPDFQKHQTAATKNRRNGNK